MPITSQGLFSLWVFYKAILENIPSQDKNFLLRFQRVYCFLKRSWFLIKELKNKSPKGSRRIIGTKSREQRGLCRDGFFK
jgi:hypothetical protein